VIEGIRRNVTERVGQLVLAGNGLNYHVRIRFKYFHTYYVAGYVDTGEDRGCRRFQPR
jgi:hypothetical protein